MRKRSEIYCLKGLEQINLIDTYLTKFGCYGKDKPKEIVLPLNDYQVEILMWLIYEYERKVRNSKKYGKEMKKRLVEFLEELTKVANARKLELEDNWYEKHLAKEQLYKNFQEKCVKEWHKTLKKVRKVDD